jgi:hypothetical protein
MKPKGAKNRFNPFKDIAPWLNDEQRQLLIDKAFELVEGVQVRKYEKGKPHTEKNEIIYDKPPDSYVIIQLLNHCFGSPSQKLKITGDSNEPLNIIITRASSPVQDK